jgi:hypothetical protein
MGSREGLSMTMVVMGIAFATTQALPAAATDCPSIVWKNGRHVRSILEND